VREEELSASKQPYVAGRVHVNRDVAEEQQNRNVPVTHENTDHGQISILNATLSSEHIEMLGADGMQDMQQPRQPAGTR
jgi:stress response protein YsnF